MSSKRSKRKSTDTLQSNPSENEDHISTAGSMAEKCADKEVRASLTLKDKKKGSMAEKCADKEVRASINLKNKKKGSMAEICADKEVGASINLKNKKKGSMAEICADKEVGAGINLKNKKGSMAEICADKEVGASLNLKNKKVILDSACILYMQMHGLTNALISDLFPSIDISFYTTRHTVQKLNKLGGSLTTWSTSLREASGYLKERCVNGSECSDEAECLLSLVQMDNQDTYIVGTSDKALYAKLYKMNVPLLSYHGGGITVDWLEQREEQRASDVSQLKKQKTGKVHKRNTIGNVDWPEQREEQRASCAPQLKKQKTGKVHKRNTIGNVSLDYYKNEDHAGYDNEGRKVMKVEQPDKIDVFLERSDEPKSWGKSIFDELDQEEVEITKAEFKAVKKMLQGKAPQA